jgi:putative transposase
MHYSDIGLVRICRLFGLSRQAYYKHGWEVIDRTKTHDIIIKLVRKIRETHPRIGTRKLHLMLQPLLTEHQIKIGRDGLFNLLSNNQLLIRRRKRKVYTTQSQHWFKKYPNLIKDIRIRGINQLWVSDITYVRKANGFLYLSLITDAYSRKVVGYHIAESLAAANTLQALHMALRLNNKPLNNLIHHSDRGIQYCSYDYTNLLKTHNISISMTQSGDPLENALAERMNGIIKNEYLFNKRIRNINHARALLNQAIDAYNNERPHSSIKMVTPNKIHQAYAN